MHSAGRSVRAPGSTANLGPGFDVLGLAVNRYCTVSDHEPATRTSAGEPTVGPCGETHIARIAYEQAGGVNPIWFDFDLPPGRGLGFSAAARVAGAVLGFVEHGHSEAEARELAYDLVNELEGHGDNAAASTFGGLQIVTNERHYRVSVGVPGELVFWTPEAITSTDESRASLPSTVPIADAVFNISRTALLIAALYEGDASSLRAATEDRLHQDLRLAASPDSATAIVAALAAGATTAWLSGSGPTIAALCPAGESDLIAESLPPHGTVLQLQLDDGGAIVL